MRILMINKFLFPNGGSETYIFKLGECLEKHGHEVQYFGMEHEGRVVGNHVNAYTADMDFHGGNPLRKLTYPFKTIYSKEARVQIRRVLEDFRPDVCHLNNFNYQLTPSILLEVVKWRKESGCSCRIVYTAHDYQLVCPNHMCNIPSSHKNCEACLQGTFMPCVKHKCIHDSFAKSVIGFLEASFWNRKKVYKNIDVIICCSHFMKDKLDTNELLRQKTVVLHNFVEKTQKKTVTKKDYVLYFGRYSGEKGVRTLMEAAKRLPEITFVFAGKGEYAEEIRHLPNVHEVGFQTGEELDLLIRQAKLSICPSEWYENCPFSVMESMERRTPVIGANIGGIPELIESGVTGELFESGKVADLTEVIRRTWAESEKLERLTKSCEKVQFDDVESYYEKLMKLYQ